ncbi:fatty acid desaturase [Pseudomonas sp. R1-1]|uniref:fatty acid desaturase family protein n=1 Tax=Pseudomonas sp. R1-1 TaxID=1602529 RepID=UPI003DA8ED1A
MSAIIQDLYERLYTVCPSLIKTRDFEDIDVTTNRMIFYGLVLVNGYQFLIAPWLIAINTWFALTLLPTLLFASTTGVMVHEAIHGLLHPNPLTNRRMGQVMAVFMGISYDLQRFDHLRHHRISRTQQDCDEVYIAERSSRRKVLGYYYRKLFGAYWHDFALTVIVCFLPVRYIYSVMSCIYGVTIDPGDHSALSITIRNRKLSALRCEGACIFLLLTCSVYLYWGNLWVLIVLYLARAFILTVLDSFAHYQTPLNDSVFARNVKVSFFVERVCLMNFNYHGAHHIFPTVPWNKIPQYMENFQPHFCLITHGSLYRSLKSKYKPPRAFRVWPTGWLPGGRSEGKNC